MINPWGYLAAGGVVIALLAGVYLQGRSDGRAVCESEYQAKELKASKLTMEQSAATMLETARRYKTHQEIVNEKNAEAEAARRDAAAAADAGQRLRGQINRLRAACIPAGNPGAVPGGAATGAAGDVLADVQRRLDQAADGIAAFADAAAAAGRACERSYDTLTN